MTYRYRGGGYIPNVPTRDLTDEEARAHGVTRSPLYERVKHGQAAPPPGPDANELKQEAGDD